MTQNLIEYKDWTIKDIEERQESFIDVALQIWKK